MWGAIASSGRAQLRLRLPVRRMSIWLQRMCVAAAAADQKNEQNSVATDFSKFFVEFSTKILVVNLHIGDMSKVDFWLQITIALFFLLHFTTICSCQRNKITKKPFYCLSKQHFAFSTGAVGML